MRIDFSARGSGTPILWFPGLLLLLVLATAPPCSGQTVHDFGSWFSLNTTGPLNLGKQTGKLRWWFDGHLRYLHDSGGFHQSIFRPGIGYQLNPNTSLWAGYGWINDLPPSGAPIRDENRIWQQLLWTPRWKTVSLMSRSRFEQRFVSTGNDAGLRFRQFFKADCPFRASSPNSLVIWDEMFIGLNETDWGQKGRFGQNRLFIGLGHKFNGPHKPKIEIGYLNQFFPRTGVNDRMNHILSFNWFATF